MSIETRTSATLVTPAELPASQPATGGTMAPSTADPDAAAPQYAAVPAPLPVADPDPDWVPA